MHKIGDSAFNSIKSATDFTNFSLSALNYLNLRDYGHFYHIADSPTAPSETYLLSYFILSYVNFDISKLRNVAYNFPSDTAYDGTAYNDNDYMLTGDRLCWGSTSQDIVHFLFISVPNPSQRKLPTLGRLDRYFIVLAVYSASRVQLKQLLR
jgi:hypothetical protein